MKPGALSLLVEFFNSRIDVEKIFQTAVPRIAHMALRALAYVLDIRRELRLVAPYLARPSIVIADDIQGNRAFAEWVAKYKPALSVAFQEEGKDVIAGFAVFLQDEHITR